MDIGTYIKVPYRFYSLQPKKVLFFFLAIARVLSGTERRESVTKALNRAGSPVYIYSILLTPALVMTSK